MSSATPPAATAVPISGAATAATATSPVATVVKKGLFSGISSLFSTRPPVPKAIPTAEATCQQLILLLKKCHNNHKAEYQKGPIQALMIDIIQRIFNGETGFANDMIKRGDVEIDTVEKKLDSILILFSSGIRAAFDALPAGKELTDAQKDAFSEVYLSLVMEIGIQRKAQEYIHIFTRDSRDPFDAAEQTRIEEFLERVANARLPMSVRGNFDAAKVKAKFLAILTPEYERISKSKAHTAMLNSAGGGSLPIFILSTPAMGAKSGASAPTAAIPLSAATVSAAAPIPTPTTLADWDKAGRAIPTEFMNQIVLFKKMAIEGDKGLLDLNNRKMLKKFTPILQFIVFIRKMGDGTDFAFKAAIFENALLKFDSIPAAQLSPGHIVQIKFALREAFFDVQVEEATRDPKTVLATTMQGRQFLLQIAQKVKVYENALDLMMQAMKNGGDPKTFAGFAALNEEREILCNLHQAITGKFPETMLLPLSTQPESTPAATLSAPAPTQPVASTPAATAAAVAAVPTPSAAPKAAEAAVEPKVVLTAVTLSASPALPVAAEWSSLNVVEKRDALSRIMTLKMNAHDKVLWTSLQTSHKTGISHISQHDLEQMHVACVKQIEAEKNALKTKLAQLTHLITSKSSDARAAAESLFAALKTIPHYFNLGAFYGALYAKAVSEGVVIADWDKQWAEYHTFDSLERFAAVVQVQLK